MVDTSPVHEAVAAVRDPELHASLGLLGAVNAVDVVGSAARVEVAMIVPETPLRPRLEEAVRSASRAVHGIDEVDVSIADATAEQRAAAVAAMKAAPRVGAPGSRTRVVTVASGKGGVGKSSVTTNLAVALADAGKLVAVIDADVWGFSIPRMLGIEEAPETFEGGILPPQAHGVRAMSMDFFVPADRAVIWRGPMLHKAIEQFLGDVLWGEPDFLLVDLPPGTGDVSISISQFTSTAQVLLVTTPQPTAERVARRAGFMADQVGQEVIGVVENMSWFVGDDGTRYELFGSGGGEVLAESLGTDLLATIPLLPAMRDAADRGSPVLTAAPDSEAAAAFRTLAQEVMARPPKVRTHPELVVR